MFKTIMAKAFSVIKRMNQWWDKDEDKGVTSIIAGIIILVGILILKKPFLFVIAFILVGNRIIHRFELWEKWESSWDDGSYDDTFPDIEDVTEVTSEFDNPESISEAEEDEDAIEQKSEK